MIFSPVMCFEYNFWVTLFNDHLIIQEIAVFKLVVSGQIWQEEWQLWLCELLLQRRENSCQASCQVSRTQITRNQNTKKRLWEIRDKITKSQNQKKEKHFMKYIIFKSNQKSSKLITAFDNYMIQLKQYL